MELKLQQFIDSVATLADLNNMDEQNPVIFQMEKPLTSIRFTIAGSKVEVSSQLVPVNTTWVVLDPSSEYYMQALKLKDTFDPDTVTNIPPVSGTNLWWHVVRTYDEIFADPQYYLGLRGPQGPAGPQGPTGPQGPAGPAGTGANLGTAVLAIEGPSVISAGRHPYRVKMTVTKDVAGVPTSFDYYVDVPVRFVPDAPLPGGFIIERSGLNVNELVIPTAPGATVDGDLHVATMFSNSLITATAPLSISSATVTGITIVGATNVYANESIDLNANVSYSDGTTVNNAVVAWSSSDVFAPINGSGLIAIGNNSTLPAESNVVTITATLNGVTDTHTVTVHRRHVQSMTVAGPNSIQEGSSGNYVATVTYNSGTVTNVTPAWSVDSAQVAISAGGVLSSATNSITSDITPTITATFTVAGDAPSVATKTVTVTNVNPGIQPFWGTGPDIPADYQSFITGLPNRGPNASRVATGVDFDSSGSNGYGYYAYPASYGYATFIDVVTSFPGGWGGAGHSGPGTNPATDAAGEDRPLEINITIDGTSVPFYVYRTEQTNLGTAATNRWNVN